MNINLQNLDLLIGKSRTILSRFSSLLTSKKGNFLPQISGEAGLQNRLVIGALVANMMLATFVGAFGPAAGQKDASLLSPVASLHSLNITKSSKEVFGFAPFWTFDKLDKVDLDTLTTVSYFGVPVLGDGSLDKSDQGYITFKSHQATEFFTKAHQHGTRVVLTLTQMNAGQILALMDNPDGQKQAISSAVDEVNKRGIDGINVDMEYSGDPGQDYRDKFTTFVADLTKAMHASNPQSKVTVSVYAASVKDPKIYDISKLSQVSDGIFMMAYDFANVSAGQAMPTAPLYGAKEGQYWYDVSSAVNDFLTVMPADKLILGVPWYGYNYAVYQPGIKAATYSWGATSQPYATAVNNDNPNNPAVTNYQEGWDNLGNVGYKAYYDQYSGSWRMIFLEDQKSLALKYDFAKGKDLAGVGIWALGFDEGKPELWQVLKDKFGQKLADASVVGRPIANEEDPAI